MKHCVLLACMRVHVCFYSIWYTHPPTHFCPPHAHTHSHTHARILTVTSAVIKPVAADVAKHYIEAYYKKLEIRLSELEKIKPVATSKKSKKKAANSKRAISFNQADSHRHKLTSGHPRRMSVDVDLLIGQDRGSSKFFRRAGSVRDQGGRPCSLYEAENAAHHI